MKSVRCLMIVMGVLGGAAVSAQAQVGAQVCGAIANHYGPFDYRTPSEALRVVESAHFTPPIAALIAGRGTSYLGSDIAYTLHVFPNHHRALMALDRLALRMKTPQPPGMVRPVECYFERAARFAPDDTVVRILWARFLAQRGRADESLVQLDQAVFYAKDRALSHYNIGLAYFDFGQFDKAVTQAQTAAALGWERPELIEQLKGAGHWPPALP